MKWFGRKAATGASRPALARAWMNAIASPLGDWPQGYEAQLRAAVVANPVAQRAMRLVSVSSLGRSLVIAATGVGDAVAAEAEGTIDGRAMLPLSPVHLRLDGDAASGVSARWVRRSRLGWAWSDGADAPLVEEREAWQVEILAGDRSIRVEDISLPTWSASAGAIAADLVGAGSDPLRLRVRQRGTHGLGSPASAFIPV